MKSKLNSHYHASLDTRSHLKPDSLYKCVLRLVTTLNDSIGVIFPALNHRLLTFHHVKNLGLPCMFTLILSILPIPQIKTKQIYTVEIYLATQRLAALLSITFTFPPPETLRLYTSMSPEIQLISLIIIATKLAYPFENSLVRRNPTSPDDPAVLNLNWDLWRSVMESEDRGVKKAKGQGLIKGQEIRVTEEEAFSMNGKELDDYLDWYQKTFVDGTDEEQKSKFFKCLIFLKLSTDIIST